MPKQLNPFRKHEVMDREAYRRALQEMQTWLQNVRKGNTLQWSADGLCREIVSTQNHDGFWALDDSKMMPPDDWFDFVVLPTCYAISIFASLWTCSSLSADMRDGIVTALRKAEPSLMKTELAGHGYDHYRGFMQCIEILASEDFVRLMKASENTLVDLGGFWAKVPEQLWKIIFYDQNPWIVGDAERTHARRLLRLIARVNCCEIFPDERVYLAYGSNMSIPRLFDRNVVARWLGTVQIPNDRLTFRQSKSGFYASLDHEENARTPGVIWAIRPEHEKQLDQFEGYPDWYDKKIIPIEHEILTEAMVYVLPESKASGKPKSNYLKYLQDAYHAFAFDMHQLQTSYRQA